MLLILISICALIKEFENNDAFKHILLHLKPNLNEASNVIESHINEFINLVNENFNESNITQFYNFILENPKYRNFVMSLFHNWGLGVKEDPRISVLRLNLGVLEEDQLSFLAYNYKSLNGISVPKGCQANIGPLKAIVDEIANNFSLFERKDSSKIYVNKDLENTDQDLINQILLNMEEIRRTNSKQIFTFIEYYITTSLTQDMSITNKIIKYLKEQYIYTKSPEVGAYLAMLYLKTEENNPEIQKEAKIMLEKAEASGIAYSYLGLGVIYFYGLGVEINYTLSFEYFMKANNSGSNEAMTYLGISYLAGLGVVPDSQKALRQIMLAANKGYLLALYTLGFMHEKGIAVFYSCRYAAEVYSVIIENKLLKNFIHDAVYDYRKNHILKAFFKFLVFSEMGSSYSLVNAANIAEKHHFNFYSNEIRLKKVFKMWKQAAILGNQKATVKVGDCYFYGLGIEQDFKDAFDHYQTAAIIFQDPEAMFNLGYMYEHGLGIKKNYPAAERFYTISSKFDKSIKILISLVLLKVRVKNMFEKSKQISHQSTVIFKENMVKVATLFKNEYETFVVILATLIVIFMTKMHLNQNRQL